MKPLGIEFRDFACFARQFVPVKPGINLLVGRNNAGKTALLRALNALSAIQAFDPPKNFVTDLSGYLASGANSFPFDLICEMEDSDKVFFDDMPDGMWARVIREGVSIWSFQILMQPRQVEFLNARVAIPDASSGRPNWQAVFLQKSGRGIFADRLRYPDLSVLARAEMGLDAFAQDGGPQNLFPGIYTGERSTPTLSQFRNVRLVSPHRVVAARSMLQTTTDLPSDAQTLAPFLITLNGQDRDTFQAIEKFVIRVFPEFKYINLTPRENNQLFVYLTEATTNLRIPLDSCGTGVEQILTLATFVLTTPKPGLILLDEPHSYLHPTAERALVEFLSEHPEHTYVISTHSAVLMNSVEPARITHISPPGRAFSRKNEKPENSRILFGLGYRNSDAMFNDQLLLVEGPSDARILPLLLLEDGEIGKSQLDRTGFPFIEGAPKGTTKLQNSILKYEKLLGAIGRGEQPRMYIFDRDRKADERAILRGTRSPVTGEPIAAEFLQRMEIENYLLVSEAISAAIMEELILDNNPRDITPLEVQGELDALLQTNDPLLFPQGRTPNGDPLAEIKGSKVLERIYEKYGISYHKERSGILIAKHISPRNQPALSEMTALVRPLFPRH